MVGRLSLREQPERPCAQGGLSFPQAGGTCEVPARLDLLPLVSLIWVFKGCLKKKKAGKL